MKFIIICGPTASGKSSLANEIARVRKGRIINADAIQVYQDIPILTAQPSVKEQEEIPHALYGFKPGDESFSVNNWLELVLLEIKKAHDEGYFPILVGGTGMYIKMLTQGFKDLPHLTAKNKQEIELDIKTHGLCNVYKSLCELDSQYKSKLNSNDTHRIIRAYSLLKHHGFNAKKIAKMPNKQFFSKKDYKVFYVSPDRESLYERSDQRVLEMLEHGGIEEVANSKAKYDNCSSLSKAIGFNEVLGYLGDVYDRETMVLKFQQNTRRFIKRQYTWFNNQLEEHIALKRPDVNEVLENL